jgi:hypothetical protein
MGLSNASKRARNYNLTVNQNQGGGSKKAGLPYQIGRESYTSVIMGNTDVVHKHCCTLKTYMTMPFTNANLSRPIGGNVGIARDYYKVPGLGKG